MILISGTIDLDPAQREGAMAAAVEVMDATRAEDGCLQYVFSADFVDQGRFYVAERWESKEAVESHMNSPHLAAFLGRMGEFGVTAASLRQWESDEGTQLM